MDLADFQSCWVYVVIYAEKTCLQMILLACKEGMTNQTTQSLTFTDIPNIHVLMVDGVTMPNSKKWAAHILFCIKDFLPLPLSNAVFIVYLPVTEW